MQELYFTPATFILFAAVAAWAVWAVRRLFSRGLCDCHGDKKEGGCSGCAGCHERQGCSAVDSMLARMESTAQTATLSKTH